MKLQSLFVILLFISSLCMAQPSFMDAQKNYPQVANAVKTRQDTIIKQFVQDGLQWPPKEIYIRSFKYDSEMELWVRNDLSSPFKLFKTYRVCALAGTLGPKRIEGDYQVPEGFYYITEFNPRSDFHLALKLNYPNQSDKVLSDSLHPGGGIYIHGSCVTVGCIPINDMQIEELYLIAAAARNNGQDFIPVHIFPIRYDNPRSVDYFARIAKDNASMQQFSVRLKAAYDYFDKEKQLPVIAINKKGEYQVM